ncbi:hypothetical protein Cylst_5872 [Cylindrospermum stagnale PCC 7417]|uniref:Uncharacterized protein n=1 Tax=Cylindrospermum stagnale PCC 7417 TaxID=56107 RepID=K9X701_9NOST|nr:hypothetical protein Cylst_5872 [Cylindrospermum stagnale PCC 7417]
MNWEALSVLRQSSSPLVFKERGLIVSQDFLEAFHEGAVDPIFPVPQ